MKLLRPLLLLAVASLLGAGCEQQTPPTEDQLLRQAGWQLKRGDIDQALKLADQAEMLWPASARPLLVKGAAHLAARRLEQSAAAYERAMEMAQVQRDRVLGATEPAEESHDLARDLHEVAGRAALGMVLAMPADTVPAVAERRYDQATQLWNQRALELSRMPEDQVAGHDLLLARLHVLVINALRGNREAALTQLDMLEAQHPEYRLIGFWRQAIRDGTLREMLQQQMIEGEEASEGRSTVP